MSEFAQPAADVAALEAGLNEAVLNGNMMEAFERYYAEDVIMQENQEKPTVGKTANRRRVLAFLDSVDEFSGARLFGSAVSENKSYSEWEFEMVFKDGNRVKMAQVAARTWRNGLVIYERFYHP